MSPARPEPPPSRRGRGARWLAAALLPLAALAWWLLRPQLKREPGLSVLLVSIDTLRADALGAYGKPDAGTPLLDRLAAEGVLFERARSHNVVTLPSHANLLSGRSPLGHGIRDNSGFRFPVGLPTLATLLKQAGYRTGAFVSAFVLDSRFGLDRGFDVYDDRLGGREVRAEFLMPERPGPETVERARHFIAAAGSQPWFAFVHLYEPHFPYQPPEELASRYASQPYQGEVAAADRALAPLLEPLLAAGDASRVLVVVTSDHGEALGEHGELTHGIFTYDASVHVPLILYAPRLLRPRRLAADVGSVDVLPTLLDALGLEAPAGLEGRSLLPLAAGTGGGDDPPTYLEALSSSLNRGWAPLHGLVDGGLKYIELPLPELYDLAADPGEQHNLAATRPEELDRLRGRLARIRAADPGVGERVQEEQAALERLRALGYVAGSGAGQKQHYTEADDPKNLVEFDSRIREVVGLYHAGRYDEALALCLENVRLKPEMPISYLHLAYLERRRGDLQAAVDAARRALELRPLDAESLSLLATYLTEAGRAAEAVELTDAYTGLAGADIDVLTARGMALAGVGRFDDALGAFAAARDADPSNSMALANAGTVYLMAGDAARARQAFEATLDIDPDVARAHNSLGVIAAREGRSEEAVERWRRAVALDPRDYQTLFNLGVTLRGQARNDEARPYLEAYLREAPLALEGRDMDRVRAWLSQTGR